MNIKRNILLFYRRAGIFLLLLLFIPLFSQIFPGTFPLELMVNPTTQASTFLL
jgi:hypothetical protein